MGNLATLSDVKTLLNISDSSQDTLLTLLISVTSSSIEAWCNRSFGAADYDLNLPPSGSQVLQLPNWPINSVAFIKDKGTTLVVNADYYLYSQYLAQGQIYRPQSWGAEYVVRGLTYDPYAPLITLEVSFNAGYLLPGNVGTAPPLPQGIQYACQLMVAKAYGLSQANNLGENLQGLAEGGLKYTWDNPSKIPSDLYQVIAGLPIQFAFLLNAYRKVGLA